MATNAGILESSSLTVVDNSLVVHIGSLDPPSVGELFKTGSSNPTTGATPTSFPITFFTNADNPAILAHSTGDTVYNRVWILPARFDFGNILTPQVVNIDVWNAFYDGTVLLDIVFTNLDGVIVTNDDTPKTFEPLELTIYNFIVGLIGTPQLNGSVQFVLVLPDTSPQTRTVYITASRVLVFPFAHDSQENIKEEFNWLTEVIESDNSTEQFIVKRLYPRRKVNFKPILTRSNTDVATNARLVGLFKSLLEGWQQRVFAIAAWQDVQSAGVNINAGAGSITINTVGRDYEIGSFAMLWKNEYYVEIVKITDVTDTTLTLEAPVQNNFATPFRIVPAKLARMNNGISVVHANHHLAEPNIDFELEPQQPVSKRLKADTYTTLNTFRVFTKKTNSKQLSLSYERKIVVADSRSGVKSIDAINVAPRVNNKYVVGVNTKLELAQMLEFLYTLKGQNGAFYIPTNLSDLIVMNNIGSGDTTFTIANIQYTAQQFSAGKNRTILILMKDGTRYYRTITNAVETNTSIETLTINSNFGVAVTLADIDKICFVRKVRLNSDRFTITHHAPTGLAMIEFGIIDTA